MVAGRFFACLLLVGILSISDVRCYQCEDDWVQKDKRCYKETRSFSTFTGARTYCKNKGAILASIPNTTVQNFIMNNVLTLETAWIGGSDEDSEGNWRWLDTEDPFNFLNWDGAEPNNDGNEDCLAILKQTGKNWNDQGCDKTQHGFICMKQAFVSPSLQPDCSCTGSNCEIGTIINQRKCTKTDVLFLIDDSASVYISGFNYAKAIISKLVDCFRIGNDEIRVALMAFGSNASTIFTFDTFTDRATIKSKIAGMSFRGQSETNTADALNKARELMNSNEPDILDIVIILTDGNSTQNIDTASNVTHHNGVYLFAMGIGGDEDSSNLRTIARNPNADYHVNSNDFFDLHTKLSKLINELCTGYNLPEFITCEMEIKDSNGEKLQSPTNGNTQCQNQQDFYGKHQPEFVKTSVMISSQTELRPNATHSDFHFGVLEARVVAVLREKSDVDHTIRYNPIKNTTDFQHQVTRDVIMTIGRRFKDSERLCLNYEAYAGGYVTFEMKNYTYGTINAKRSLCYFYDDIAPRHCSDIGKCTYPPIQLDVDITNSSHINASFAGWTDFDSAAMPSVFASGIQKFEVSLHEMEYSNGILNMKEESKINGTDCNDCKSFLIELPRTNVPVLYGVKIQVVDVALNPRQARRFVLYDASSMLEIHEHHILKASSASGKTNNMWQTNLDKVCYNWTGRYYNNKFVHYNPLSIIDPGFHNHFKGVYEQTTGRFRVNGTTNIHGIIEFRYTIQKDETFVINDQLTPNFPQETLCTPVSGISDGNTIYFNITVRDLVGHEIKDSVVHHIDSSPPEINQAWLVKDGFEEVFVHNSKDLSVMALHIKAFDIDSGLHSFHWSIRNEDDQVEFGSGALGVYHVAKCPNSRDCYCPSVGDCQLMNYTLVMNSLVVNNTHKGKHHRKYTIKLEVTNRALLNTTEMVTVLVDESAPETGVVREGSPGSVDIDYTSDLTITISWEGFIDHESGIKFYRLGLSNSCLNLESLLHAQESKIEYYDTEQQSMRVTLNYTKEKVYASVIAFNKALEPSKVACSDGIVVDTSPPNITNVRIRNLKTGPSIGCADKTFWYVTEDLKKTKITCNQTCISDSSDTLLQVLPEIEISTISEEVCQLNSFKNEYMYLGNDFLDISWNISDSESSIEHVFIGIGSSESSKLSPDIFGYFETHYNTFYRLGHPGLEENSIVYVFIKGINKANRETVISVGPVVIDETPPLCIKKPTVELAKDSILVSWTKDNFIDNDQRGALGKILYRIEVVSSAVVTDFMKWTNNSVCRENRLCTTFPLVELQDFDGGRNQKYQFQFHAFNAAGHFCEIISEEFSLPSPLLPTHGTVFDADGIAFGESHDIEDIDVSFSLDSYCVFWKEIEHVESLTYEIGVGIKQLSDDVIPLHYVNGSLSNQGWYFCEPTTKLKTFKKYYVVVRAHSSGGSISLSTDGFVIIDHKDLNQSIKVNDGQGCSFQNPVFKQNFTDVVQNGSSFTVYTPFPLVIGATYTTFINILWDDLEVNSKEVSLLSKTNNSFTFIPQLHQPVFILSSNWTSNVNSFAIETKRCVEDIQVQDQFDITGANWKINETLAKYISHFVVTLMSCGETQNTVCEPLSSKLVTKERRSFVFRELYHVLKEGFYKISLKICFRRNCIFGGYSDGFYIEANGPQYGSFSTQLDLNDNICATLRLHFDDFRCSYPLEPFPMFYKWALFAESKGSLQITEHNIHYNGSGKEDVTSCIVLPNHPHKAMHVCLEGYCGSSRVSKTCVPVNIKQDPNIFKKDTVYDLDARSPFFSDIEAYKFTKNIGNKMRNLHNNEINFRATPFKLGGFMVGLGNTENLWSVMKSAHVPVRCTEDDDCIVAELGTGGLIEFSSKLPVEYNNMYYTCVNVTEDASLSQCSNGFMIDNDPPTKGEVTVQTQKRGFIIDRSVINVHWSGFVDNELSRSFGYPSSIKYYEIAIGTKKGNDDVLNFQNIGLSSAISLTNISLFGGISYYFSIKAHDHAGIFIIGSSDSYIFDATSPVLGQIYIGHYLNHLSFVTSNRLVAHLTGFLDNESGIEKIEIGVGSTNNSADVISMVEHNYMLTPFEITEDGALFDGHIYYILARVWNYAGLSTSLSSDPFVFDNSPPERGIVTDRHSTRNIDVDNIRNSTISSNIRVHWTEFVDKHSHLEFYRIGLGSQKGITDVNRFTHIGKRLDWEWTIPLVPGKTYFSTVEGCNIAGLCSQATSNGVVIDNSPPVPGYVIVGTGDVKYIPDRSHLFLEWGNFVDVESDIVQYDVCVSTDAVNCDVLPWKNFRTQQSALLLNISLPINQDLYAIIKARNKVGLATRQSSHSFRVDDTPPVVFRSPTFVSKENASSIYDTSVLHVEWGYIDVESPIKVTVISLKLHDGGHTEIDNIIVEGNTTFVKSLNSKEWLRDGDSYYVVVTACNMAGLCASNKSKSVVFDGTPPVHGHILDDGTWSNKNATLTFNWKDYSDPESGVKSYYLTIGDTHSGSEISQRTIDVIHSDKANSTQTGIFNISRFLKAGDKIVFSIWASNNANLNGTVRRVTFIAVPSNQNNSDGRLIIERHSCSVSYCTNDCTCAVVGGKCLDILNPNSCHRVNSTHLLNNSKLELRIFGPMADDWTPSSRCLEIELYLENINASRHEWSLGLKDKPYGYGIFDISKEQVWHDVSLQTRVVHCLKPGRQLLHGHNYVGYVKTWISDTEYLLTESKPILIDTTPPSIRRGKFIMDSDTDCSRDKEYSTTTDILSCWQGVFSDAQSGIREYRVMISVMPGGYEISGIRNVGLATNISWNLPNLVPGVKYFTSVEAINYVGHSTVLTSDGIIIDSTAPIKGTLYTSKFFHNERWSTETATLSASWEGFLDFESFINNYLFSVIDVNQNSIIQDINVGILNRYTVNGLSLVHGTSYILTVRAEDAAGHTSNITFSEPITIDTTKPTGYRCKRFSEQSKINRIISTNRRQVLESFQFNQSTIYKMTLKGNIRLNEYTVEIEINGQMYDMPVNHYESEIIFTSPASTTDLSIVVYSPQNQNLTIQISLFECKNLETSDAEAIVIQQISSNYLKFAVNVMDDESGIKYMELYLGTHSKGRQIKSVGITSPFTFYKIFVPLSHGTVLYISAMAENNANLKQYFISSPIVWDQTPPNIQMKNASLSHFEKFGDVYSSVLVEWDVEENESAVAYCQCALGTHIGFRDIAPWKDSNDIYSWQSSLNISHGTHVYPSVRCFNKVGLYMEVNRKQPLIVSFIPPQPLSHDVNFAVHSATIQNAMNVQRVATSLQFHWPVFQDLSKLSTYSVCIKTDNRIVYDWTQVGTHNYFSVEGLSLSTTSNYTVFVRGTNVGNKQSETINSSISIIDIIPIQTGNACVAISRNENKVLVSWKQVFLLNLDMEPHFVIHIGSKVGNADLLHNLKTSSTEVLLSTTLKQIYVVISANYVTDSESTYREMITIKT